MTGHEMFLRWVEHGGSSQHLLEQAKAWERLAAEIEERQKIAVERAIARREKAER